MDSRLGSDYLERELSQMSSPKGAEWHIPGTEKWIEETF